MKTPPSLSVEKIGDPHAPGGRNRKPLTETETTRREKLIAVVRGGLLTFVELGDALRELCDSKLYRETHETFEAFCQDVFELSRPRAYQLIEAAEIRNHLSTKVDILPENERQCRALSGVPKRQLAKVWNESLGKSPKDKDGKPKPTYKQVKAIADESKSKKRSRVVGNPDTRGDAIHTSDCEFIIGDCVQTPFADDHFDLAFCSPPYEAQRDYDGLRFNLSGEEWVDWAVLRFLEHLRVCKGLVAWVVEGVTRNYTYSATPLILAIELQRRGVKLRKPCVYHRQGIPGSGGPDWLRNDWEFVLAATKRGKLPWSENTAMGAPSATRKPRAVTRRDRNSERDTSVFFDPDIANPGNVIAGRVGNGHLGWTDAHENEAPFPEWLANFFIRSFCPPGGIVFDGFSGSGTTVAAAVKAGRRGVGMDIRENQVRLGQSRLRELEMKNG